MGRIFAISSCLGWIAFIIIDYYWNHIISDAVQLRQGSFGELYGPLSFFRPIILYTSILLSFITSVLVLRNKVNTL
jgi:hypothetical protein